MRTIIRAVPQPPTVMPRVTETERVILANTAALAVYERGKPGPDRATVVLAHGWPDSHAVWDLVADRLADRFHVVSYDMRGVGRSAPALTPKPYTLDKLAADLDAVVTAVSPDRPVHLVGHDWGSVTGWEHLMTRAYDGHLASFTSLSGPNLDHIGWLLRQRPRRRHVRPLLGQMLKSSYTMVLSVPLVRTSMWRLGGGPAFRRWLRVTERVEGYPGPGLAEDAIAAVGLYRHNILARLRRPALRPVGLPVQLIVATRDHYVSPRLLDTMADWVPDLTRTEVAAGHWSPRTHPDRIASLVTAHVDAVEARADERTPA